MTDSQNVLPSHLVHCDDVSKWLENRKKNESHFSFIRVLRGIRLDSTSQSYDHKVVRTSRACCLNQGLYPRGKAAP